jgi:hypothetical protein
MSERNDSETQSYREEQGKPAVPDGRERMGDVPLAPSSAGIVGAARRSEESTTDADRQAAEERQATERGEVF